MGTGTGIVPILMEARNDCGQYSALEIQPGPAEMAEAIAQGVPQEDIVTDHAGFSTYDSLYRARDIFGAERVVIVTQEYHLSRALYLAEALGLEAWGVAAAPRNDAGQIGRDFREVLARDKAFLWAIFQPKPKFLGDPVPLT